MQLTTVMVGILMVWCLVTIFTRGFQPVPLPTPQNMHLGKEAVGWLQGTGLPMIPVIAILIGLGHSLLAMSGEETLAQVNREIASPKLKNLQRAGLVIFIYSMLFTSLVSFFAVMLIPDSERVHFLDNLIGGLAMHLAGPLPVRMLFHAFVVLVGAIILSGAVNTSIIGSNGVLNRVAEDGVLPDWLRHPHKRFGTTHRFINLITALQVITILISRGDVDLLGQAYAFGVVWSFSMNALSVLVLRYKQPEARAWKAPLNLRFRKTEIPLGLGLVTLILFTLAGINLFTKKEATLAGAGFTAVFFMVFDVSERYHRKRKAEGLDKFRLDTPEELSIESVNLRPGNVLVAVRNPHLLEHLNKVLQKTDTGKMDIAVVTVKVTERSGFGGHALQVDELFSSDISRLFSLVVSLAEKAGKHVELLVVPGRDPSVVLVETAQRLQSSLVVMNLSGKMPAAEQAKAFGDAWETLPQPRPQLSLEIHDPRKGVSFYFNLGPHPPRLWPDDLDLLHRLWLELSEKGLGAKLHHRDVVRVALRRLDADLRSGQGREVLKDLSQEVGGSQDSGVSPERGAGP
jgi:hypothetical protein